MKFRILVAVGVILISTNAWAAKDNNKSTSSKLPPSIDALKAYPKAIRMDILEVSLHHNLLLEVKAIQNDAIESLGKLIGKEPRKFKEQVLRILRFPRLVRELGTGGVKSNSQINAILKPYPREIHKEARALARNHYKLLAQLTQINADSDKRFRKAIEGYPEKTKQAFLKVLQHPPILHILTKNPKYTYQLGQAYATGHDSGKNTLSQVSPQARKKDQIAEATRKQELALDPQAEKLNKAAQEFTKKANAGLDEVLDPKKAVQVNATFNPYFYGYESAGPNFYSDPYWYGYPDTSWYPWW